MAPLCINSGLNEIERTWTLGALNKVPRDAQGWVEAMARKYITRPMAATQRIALLDMLIDTPVEIQEWIQHMAHLYITRQISEAYRGYILGALKGALVESQAWVEGMARRYITDKMDGKQIGDILAAFRNTRPEAQQWMEDLLFFLIDSHHDPETIQSTVSQLSILQEHFVTPLLLEQARFRLIAGVNQAREEGQLLAGFFYNLVTLIRDELTQGVEMSLAPSRPLGRAREVHFASTLQIPSEEGVPIPLYKAVNARVWGLTTGKSMKLRKALSILHDWIERDAEKEKKSLYHQVLTKGYGDGANPEYNQEITPLLRFVVPYMSKLVPAVQSGWLLPALEEAATAYDEGDPVSCGKGIQERLTVVGLDVEGVDAVLRSLSKYARDYLYIVDPTTNGADTWVRDVIKYLSKDERGSLLKENKLEKEIFNSMLERALSLGLHQEGLTTRHVTALLENTHIRERFSQSIEMHYEYEKHYQALQAKARELQTPEERRDLVARQIERRLMRGPENFDQTSESGS